MVKLPKKITHENWLEFWLGIWLETSRSGKNGTFLGLKSPKYDLKWLGNGWNCIWDAFGSLKRSKYDLSGSKTWQRKWKFRTKLQKTRVIFIKNCSKKAKTGRFLGWKWSKTVPGYLFELTDYNLAYLSEKDSLFSLLFKIWKFREKG